MSDMRMEWWNDFRQRGVEDLRKQVLRQASTRISTGRPDAGLGGMITA